MSASNARVRNPGAANGHKDLLDQLEPRLDKKTFEQWKAVVGKAPAAGGAVAGGAAAGGTVAMRAEVSDNATTMRINQFAADIYPTVYAHLQAARALEISLEKRDTTQK